jgi:hypothetical protein
MPGNLGPFGRGWVNVNFLLARLCLWRRIALLSGDEDGE